MFLKVVRWYSDEPEGKVYNHESIWECSGIHVHAPGDDKVRFDLEGSQEISIEVDKKEKIAVYLMNDAGRTIDTYRWATE